MTLLYNGMTTNAPAVTENADCDGDCGNCENKSDLVQAIKEAESQFRLAVDMLLKKGAVQEEIDAMPELIALQESIGEQKDILSQKC